MTTVVTGLEVAHAIEGKFPGAVVEALPEFAAVKAEKLVEVLSWLRDDDHHWYKFLSSLTGVDRIDWFEVVYHIESFKHNRITTIKVLSEDLENPAVPSVVPVWLGAQLQEREAYDLLGIRFEGNPDLRRIFLWEGFAGWPLRKDYLNMPGGEMAGLERFPGEPGVPLSGRGTE
ncbi:MAG TPA: NADH-quinone oxidoreductase subunit C [Dehalococcoidia bacterium]|nr:NADH-quinone oxidoreductase subunit C [Dehalococcoidia bacterium]